MAKKEETWYVVPEVEVRVHESWINLIHYCQENLPYGDLKIQVANAIPTDKIKETPNIRFDKQNPVKATGTTYLIPSLDVYVHEQWINLIQWCQNYFTKGKVEFRLVNACPTELLGAQQSARFDKPETIPAGLPLNFGR